MSFSKKLFMVIDVFWGGAFYRTLRACSGGKNWNQSPNNNNPDLIISQDIIVVDDETVPHEPKEIVDGERSEEVHMNGDPGASQRSENWWILEKNLHQICMRNVSF